MLVLDTNALIRFFTNDDKVKASQIRLLIQNQAEIEIPDVVFPELEYVLLSSVYKSTKLDILKAFKFLLSQNQIIVSPEVRKAIEIYEDSKLDMADCIIAATAITNNCKLVTFDGDLKRTTRVRIYKFT